MTSDAVDGCRHRLRRLRSGDRRFLTTLSKGMARAGSMLEVLCYERADDIGFGVSGVVTRARGIRATLPDLDPSAIPMATPVTQEKVVYLLDPHGASRRSAALRVGRHAGRAGWGRRATTRSSCRTSRRSCTSRAG